jgi:hypothetical protein
MQPGEGGELIAAIRAVDVIVCCTPASHGNPVVAASCRVAAGATVGKAQRVGESSPTAYGFYIFRYLDYPVLSLKDKPTLRHPIDWPSGVELC